VNCCVLPVCTDAVAGETAIVVNTGTAVTVTLAVPLTPPLEAVTVNGPPTVVAVPPPEKPQGIAGVAVGVVLASLLVAGGLFAPGEFLEHLTVFLLACVVGSHVVWNVTPALHTPLMSVTNAISGIILVGGVLLLRVGGTSVPTLLAGAAILVAMINVAGGFLVTSRMLKMFRRAPGAKESKAHGGHK